MQFAHKLYRLVCRTQGVHILHDFQKAAGQLEAEKKLSLQEGAAVKGVPAAEASETQAQQQAASGAETSTNGQAGNLTAAAQSTAKPKSQSTVTSASSTALPGTQQPTDVIGQPALPPQSAATQPRPPAAAARPPARASAVSTSSQPSASLIAKHPAAADLKRSAKASAVAQTKPLAARMAQPSAVAPAMPPAKPAAIATARPPAEAPAKPPVTAHTKHPAVAPAQPPVGAAAKPRRAGSAKPLAAASARPLAVASAKPLAMATTKPPVVAHSRPSRPVTTVAARGPAASLAKPPAKERLQPSAGALAKPLDQPSAAQYFARPPAGSVPASKPRTGVPVDKQHGLAQPAFEFASQTAAASGAANGQETVAKEPSSGPATANMSGHGASPTSNAGEPYGGPVPVRGKRPAPIKVSGSHPKRPKSPPQSTAAVPGASGRAAEQEGPALSASASAVSGVPRPKHISTGAALPVKDKTRAAQAQGDSLSRGVQAALANASRIRRLERAVPPITSALPAAGYHQPPLPVAPDIAAAQDAPAPVPENQAASSVTSGTYVQEPLFGTGMHAECLILGAECLCISTLCCSCSAFQLCHLHQLMQLHTITNGVAMTFAWILHTALCSTALSLISPCT